MQFPKTIKRDVVKDRKQEKPEKTRAKKYIGERYWRCPNCFNLFDSKLGDILVEDHISEFVEEIREKHSIELESKLCNYCDTYITYRMLCE